MRMDKHIVRRAMAGDEDAQQACTEAGEALPCHACGGECKHIDDEAFGDIVICQKAGCSGGQHVFYPNAHEALTAHNTRAKLQEEPNEALTLEELREMNGAPVYVTVATKRGDAYWCIVDAYNGLFTHAAGTRFSFNDQRVTAYRRPPEMANILTNNDDNNAKHGLHSCEEADHKGINGMCCDCKHLTDESIDAGYCCCDCSENMVCANRREDGSCWEDYDGQAD